MGVMNNDHHKCCTFDPTFNEINCMTRSTPLKLSFTPKSDRNVKTENMVKMMKQDQRSVQEGIDSRQIRGRNNKQPVMKVVSPILSLGITTTVYNQEEIVVAAAESNLRRQSQTVSTVFRQPALFDAFGSYALIGHNCLGVLDGSFVPHEDADPHAISLLETMCSYSHSKIVVLSIASPLR